MKCSVYGRKTAIKSWRRFFFATSPSQKGAGKFSVYTDIRQKLIERGIPEAEIKFIHEADTETKEQELFKKVRRGEVRILMGSTQKMGAGTNVQNKIIASHDIDCPWRPADVEQSEVARQKALITGLSQKILTQAQALDCCRWLL